MKLQLASIAPRAGQGPAQLLLDEYVRRTQPYFAVEQTVYKSEAAFLAAMEKLRGRTAPAVVLLDPRGKQRSSEQIAELLTAHRDGGTQALVFAIGPADGWSGTAKAAARELLSFGPMTLPHELARVVLSEQVYRAATILAGHPYHGGHSSPATGKDAIS